MRGAVKPSGIDGGTLFQNEQFEAVAGIMRPAPEIMSADNAGTPDGQAATGADDAAGQSAMSAEVDAQIKRIRDEITEAVDSVPGLTSQLKEDGMADGTAPAMTPEQAAEYYSQLVLNFARRMETGAGIPAAEILRRYNTRGLARDKNGRLLTPEAYEARLKGMGRPGNFPTTPFVNTVAVRGDELGIPKEAGLKAYMDAAKRYHDTLKYESEHGNPVIQPQLNKPVRFSGKGWRKNQSAGANSDKWKLFPKLREIIENSTLVHTEEVSKLRKDGFTRFHWVECHVNFEGTPRRVGLTLAEDSDGNLFYNLNADVDVWQKNNDSSNLPAQSMAGELESLYQDASAPDVSNIRTTPNRVNLHILSQDARDFARASFTPVSDGYLIQLYEGADLSSLIHETGHFFQAELEEALRSGAAGESLKADCDTLQSWLGGLDDDTALRAEYERYQRHSVYGGTEFASLSESRKQDVRSRARSEMFARGFEQYLREGRAPSPALEGVFARFKKWLTRIYRKALDLNVKLTDEVRGVFDRLLAIEDRNTWAGAGGSSPVQPSTPLAARFADMPMIEADSSQWFGEGKEIETDRRNLRKTLKEWAKKQFPQGTAVKNSDQGWDVLITPKGIERTLSHGFDETLARSVPFIPQIIESGIYLGEGKKTNTLVTHIFANKIRLDGQDYVVGFVVREDVNGNRFYDHELTEIINPDSLNADRLPNGSEVHATRANRGDVMNILRERLGVNDGTGRVLFQPASLS